MEYRNFGEIKTQISDVTQVVFPLSRTRRSGMRRATNGGMTPIVRTAKREVALPRRPLLPKPKNPKNLIMIMVMVMVMILIMILILVMVMELVMELVMIWILKEAGTGELRSLRSPTAPQASAISPRKKKI